MGTNQQIEEETKDKVPVNLIDEDTFDMETKEIRDLLKTQKFERAIDNDILLNLENKVNSKIETRDITGIDEVLNEEDPINEITDNDKNICIDKNNVITIKLSYP